MDIESIPPEVTRKAMDAIQREMESQIMSALAITPAMMGGGNAATPKYRLARCINNLGLEDRFDEGEIYVIDVDRPSEDMVYVWDREENRHECFPDRFEDEETIIEAFQDQKTMLMGGYRLRTKDSRLVISVPVLKVGENNKVVTV